MRREAGAKKWVILFCDPQIRACPVADFLESCRVEQQVKVVRILELLEELGPNLSRPYADLLRDGVHELRLKLSGEQVRMLYFFCFERYIVFYEVLRKHTDRVPDHYIDATQRYRRDFLDRIDVTLVEGGFANGHA
jgi:hypothetical protein